MLNIPHKDSICEVDVIGKLEHFTCIMVKGVGYVCVIPSWVTPDKMRRLGDRVALALEHNPRSFNKG